MRRLASQVRAHLGPFGAFRGLLGLSGPIGPWENAPFIGTPWEFSCLMSLGKSVCSNDYLGSLSRDFWKEFYYPGKFISLK